jgi:ABC-2 type transport system permease protein
VSGRRIGALFRRVTEEIRRDRPSIALLFIAPLIITGLVTFILREGERPTIEAVIVNQAGQPGTVVAGVLEEALREQDATVTEVPDEATARSMIEDDRASVAIVLPAELLTTSSPAITVITNGLDPAGEGTQLAALQKALLAGATAATGRSLPTIEHATVYGTPSEDPITPYAPALVAFFVYFFVYLLTGVSFLRERTGGTLERLMATPVARGEIVTGYTLGFGLFAVVQVTLIMLWVLGTIHVPAIGPLPAFSIGLGITVAGSPLLAFVVVLLLAMGAVSLGIFLSSFARTELQIIQFIPIVIVPQFLLSGVIFPVSSLPAVIQPIAPLLPLSYAVDGLRQVFIRGADLGVDALRIDLLVLTGFALFFAVIAALTIRREVV